jgi:hypothetical protein
MKGNKMKIRGIEVSEDTIVEALKKHIDFKEPVKDFKVWKFYARLQPGFESSYILAIELPDVGCDGESYELPAGCKGRGAFSKGNIKRIIEGLQELIKD